MLDEWKTLQASREIAIAALPESPKFGELPAEIQLLVWKIAANFPRAVQIQSYPLLDSFGYFWEDFFSLRVSNSQLCSKHAERPGRKP